MKILSVVLLCAVPVAGIAQPMDSLDLKSKLRFHGESVYGPWSIAQSATYAGILQGIGSPDEWGQGSGTYGKRLASTVGRSAIHGVLAVCLDSALHQDPRYFRSRGTGFWRRTGHALRGTILTRNDRGGETLSTWRLGSAYGRQQPRFRVLARSETQDVAQETMIGPGSRHSDHDSAISQRRTGTLGIWSCQRNAGWEGCLPKIER